MLEPKGLCKQYGKFAVVDSVDLSVDTGEFFCLPGPSGCGKTTILRMIAGFEEPTQGVIHFDGRDITQQPLFRRNASTAFQNNALFPNLDERADIAAESALKGTP